MKRIGGSRRKTRYISTKNVKTRGKISLKKYFQEFNAGDKVVLLTDSSCHRGMFFRRFYGLIGTIVKKIGKNRDSCYTVVVKDSGKQKEIIAHPVHLKKLEVKE